MVPFVGGGRKGIESAGRGDPFRDTAGLSIGIGGIVIDACVNGVCGWRQWP